MCLGYQPLGSGLLAQSDAAVLQRREHSSGHVVVVHLLGRAGEDPTSQQAARVYGDGRELGPVLEHVAHRVDVGHVRLFGRGNDLAVFGYRLKNNKYDYIYKSEILG